MLVLHHCPLSAASRAVKWFLILHNIPHTDTPSSDPLAVTLEDADITLTECGAILMYLAAKYSLHVWYSDNLFAKAKIHEAILRSSYPTRRVSTVLVPSAGSLAATAKAIADLEPIWASFAALSTTFLVGDCPTVADLVVTCEVNQMLGFGGAWESIASRHPRVQTYIQSMRLAVPHYDDIASPAVNAIQDKVKAAV